MFDEWHVNNVNIPHSNICYHPQATDLLEPIVMVCISV